MISSLGHSLGHGDDGTLRILRNDALGIEDAILESLAKLRGGGIVLARKPLAQATEKLGQHHACTAPGTEDSCRSYPA